MADQEKQNLKYLIVGLFPIGMDNEKHATSIEEAVDLLKKEKFDVVIYNTKLHVECCCDITKKLKENFDGILFPVVYYSDVDKFSELTDGGVDDVILFKELDKKNLEKLVKGALAHKRFYTILAESKKIISKVV